MPIWPIKENGPRLKIIPANQGSQGARSVLDNTYKTYNFIRPEQQNSVSYDSVANQNRIDQQPSASNTI
jgi:hypothetical protein